MSSPGHDELRRWREQGRAPAGSCPFCASRISVIERDGVFVARCSHRGCGARGPKHHDLTRACDLFCCAPLRRENDVLRSNGDHLSSKNASLSSQVESMAMRIESLAEELAKPEDVRLREVLDELEGRAVIFDGLGARVGHLLDEMDEWIGRAGEAERMVEAARRSLASVADHMTEHAYQELASALESPPRIAGKTAGFDQPGREHTVGDALGLRRDR